MTATPGDHDATGQCRSHSTSPRLTTSITPAGPPGISVLHLGGTLDPTAVPQLTAALDQVVTRGRRAALVDSAELSSCSIHGLVALAATAERAAAESIGFIVVGLSPRHSQLYRTLCDQAVRTVPGGT